MLPVVDYKLRIRLAPVPVAVLASAALAACGGSGASHGGASGPYGPRNSPVALSRCMRANGFPSFPDPRAGPSGGVGFPGGLVENQDGSLVVDGVPITGPRLAHAKTVCAVYLPPAGGPPPLSEKQKHAAVANARCMREHGIANFPDPTFGGASVNVPLPAGLNPQSPAFRQAARACGLLRP